MATVAALLAVVLAWGLVAERLARYSITLPIVLVAKDAVLSATQVVVVELDTAAVRTLVAFAEGDAVPARRSMPGCRRPGRRRTRRSRRRPRRCAHTPSSWGLTSPMTGCSKTKATPARPLVRPALERLRDLVAGVGIDVVLCYSPDRLARKFAYQALLIEEFTRAGTRVEFIKGPRGDSPEDQDSPA